MKTYIRLIKPYVSKYYEEFFTAIILSLIYTALSFLSPILSQYLIDNVLVKNNNVALNNMVFYLFIGLVLTTIFSVVQNLINIRLFNKINFDIKSSIFRHLVKLDVGTINELQTGIINYRIFGDSEILKNSLSSWLIGIITNIAQVIFIVIYMITLNPKLAVSIIAVNCISIIVIKKSTRRILNCSVEKKNKTDHLMSKVTEVFVLFNLIKACNNEKMEEDRFNNNLRDITDTTIREQTLIMISNSICGILSTTATFIVLFLGGKLVIEKQLTLGQLMAFLLISGMVIGPIASLTNSAIGFQDIKSSSLRVNELFSKENRVYHSGENLMPKIKGEIEFKNVTFGYSSDYNVLNNISFKIREKSIVSIIGKSGIGKSTISSLIARFYNPLSGSILVDGYDINNIDIAYYNKNIGLVLQNKFIFSGTIYENISLGDNSYTREQVMEAAKLANADIFIEKLPDKYWTQIGETAVQLSGGEAQRIALARIFLQCPPIVILDEATSFIDLESEEYIHDAIKKLSQISTVIIITHKLSTAKLASKIILVDKCSVIEEGTHDELINKEGSYQRLYRRILS